MNSQATGNAPISISSNKIAAGLAQLGSFATTWLFIRALGYTGADGFGIAVVVEFILTAGKFSLLRGRGDALGGVSVLLDTLLNAGGMWPIVQKFGNTPSAVMLSESLGLAAELRPIPALFFALVFGFLLSALPHWLWARK